MYQEIDRDNMFDAIWQFPDNLSDAIELGKNINLINDYNDISNIVIAGMGGSAIGGDVVSILEKVILIALLLSVEATNCPIGSMKEL